MNNILKNLIILSEVIFSYNICYSTESNNDNYYQLTDEEYDIIYNYFDQALLQGQDGGRIFTIPIDTNKENNGLEDKFIQYCTENNRLLLNAWNNINNFVQYNSNISKICNLQYSHTNDGIYQIKQSTDNVIELYCKILCPIIFNRLLLDKQIPASDENINIANKTKSYNIVNIFKYYEEQYNKKCEKLIQDIDISISFIGKVIDIVNSSNIQDIKDLALPLQNITSIKEQSNNIKYLYYYSNHLNYYKDFIEQDLLGSMSFLKCKMFLNAI